MIPITTSGTCGIGKTANKIMRQDLCYIAGLTCLRNSRARLSLMLEEAKFCSFMFVLGTSVNNPHPQPAPLTLCCQPCCVRCSVGSGLGATSSTAAAAAAAAAAGSSSSICWLRSLLRWRWRPERWEEWWCRLLPSLTLPLSPPR